jgi:hypothetical protein
MMKKSWINFLLFNLLTVCCAAQTAGFKFYSVLEPVKTPGFYHIEFHPEINAHLKTDFSDLRIVNGAGKWVPHRLHSPATERINHSVTWDLKFSETESSKLKTELIIENEEKISSDFSLVITNTAAERFGTLSGSADNKSWFVINDSILLNPVPSKDGFENSFMINFPPNNYRFYKLIIHNNNKDPFNIKGVRTNNPVPDPGNPFNKLVENPVGNISQKDSGKISYIRVTQQLPYHFDHLSLLLSNVKYYNRQVDLYVPDIENHSFSNPGRHIQSFTVSNNSTLTFKAPLTKSRIFYLLIRNEDNLPLKVNEVKTASFNHYVITYLEAGDDYKLLMDNQMAVTPNYDIPTLSDKTPDSIPLLQFGKLTAMDENGFDQDADKNNGWILWSSIAAALLTLLFFTYKMLKEVDKRKTA